MTPAKKDSGNGNGNADDKAAKAANKHSTLVAELTDEGSQLLEELGEAAVGDIRKVVAGLVGRAAK